MSSTTTNTYLLRGVVALLGLILIAAVIVIVALMRTDSVQIAEPGDSTSQGEPEQERTLDRDAGYDAVRATAPSTATWTNEEIDSIAASFCLHLNSGATVDDLFQMGMEDGLTDNDLEMMVAMATFAETYECPQ